jgi:membrane protease YdiL (CAAX protease family)
MRNTRKAQMNDTGSRTGLLTKVINHLRRSHLTRATAYFVVGGATMQGLGMVVPRARYFDLERIHLLVFPITLAVTRGFAQLRPEDQARWTLMEQTGSLGKALQGAGIGSAALLAMLGIARAQGWVSAPHWGEATDDGLTPAESAAILAVSHLAIAINEELVFRGYGYTTLSLALPEPLPSAIVTALFAMAHPIKLRTLVGEAALGLALLALRQRSGSIWMPVGFHWASNFLQSAVFGPPDGAPSLRPLQLHGPAFWLGRPGHPDPGLLATLTCLAVAAGIWLWPAADRA